MAKKDLATVTADLSALAMGMPTQRPAVAAPPPADAPAPKAAIKSKSPAEPEPIAQFSLGLRKVLRNELANLARDADMTMRAFVLLALKDKGLSVRDEDLLDLRRERR
jgi:hypothetical protein